MVNIAIIIIYFQTSTSTHVLCWSKMIGGEETQLKWLKVLHYRVCKLCKVCVCKIWGWNWVALSLRTTIRRFSSLENSRELDCGLWHRIAHNNLTYRNIRSFVLLFPFNNFLLYSDCYSKVRKLQDFFNKLLLNVQSGESLEETAPSQKCDASSSQLDWHLGLTQSILCFSLFK